uniref:Uncharacterized protein n=1 Tax=Ixodes ricinus TaxID=34613 RepID=A0A6B0UCR6_IXORI
MFFVASRACRFLARISEVLVICKSLMAICAMRVHWCLNALAVQILRLFGGVRNCDKPASHRHKCNCDRTLIFLFPQNRFKSLFVQYSHHTSTA